MPHTANLVRMISRPSSSSRSSAVSRACRQGHSSSGTHYSPPEKTAEEIEADRKRIEQIRLEREKQWKEQIDKQSKKLKVWKLFELDKNTTGFPSHLNDLIFTCMKKNHGNLKTVDKMITHARDKLASLAIEHIEDLPMSEYLPGYSYQGSIKGLYDYDMDAAGRAGNQNYFRAFDLFEKQKSEAVGRIDGLLKSGELNGVYMTRWIKEGRLSASKCLLSEFHKETGSRSRGATRRGGKTRKSTKKRRF